MAGMVGLPSRHVVAFDASEVVGAALSWRPAGFRLRSLARRALSKGALQPSPFDDNLLRPEEVVSKVRSIAEELGFGTAGVCLVLPDGLARLVLLDVAPGVEALEFARYRLLPTLPYPPEEAILDVLPVGGRRVAAAAARRSVVQGYEAAAEAAGLVQERLDLAPLAALAILGEARPAPDGIDLLVGDAALSLFARSGGALISLRSRRRVVEEAATEAHEWAWLEDELRRSASAAGLGDRAPVRVFGRRGPELAGELVARGWPAGTGTNPATDPSSAPVAWPWLGATG
jgi:hypothetical protein